MVILIGNRPSIVIVEKVILACLMWDKIFDNTTERIAVLNRNSKDRRNIVSAKRSMAESKFFRGVSGKTISLFFLFADTKQNIKVCNQETRTFHLQPEYNILTKTTNIQNNFSLPTHSNPITSTCINSSIIQ